MSIKNVFKLVVVTGCVILTIHFAGVRLSDYDVYDYTSETALEAEETVTVPDDRLKLSEARQINQDTKAWVNIPGLGVDYPVMDWVVGDNEAKPFYDRKDIHKSYAFEGSIYGGEGVVFAPFNDLSNNLLLYGHNLDDNPLGKKFAKLVNFQDINVARNTPYIFVTTEDAQLIYQIYAVFFTDIDFKYFLVGCSEEDQKYIIDEAKRRSEYIYDVDVAGKDKIITLSTCTYRYGKYHSYGQENTRFVIQGKLIDNNSKLPMEASLKPNPNPKKPQLMDK